MLRFLSVTLALCAICSFAYCSDVELKSIDVQPAKVNPNLVSNGSFELVDASGKAINWKVQNNVVADTSFVFDTSNAVGGYQSLKITNRTPLETGSLGLLSLTKLANAELGKPFTLSAWIKSDDPGVASIVGGQSWRHRLTLMPTGGQWKPVSMTVTPEGPDAKFGVYVQSESPTKGFWLDDIKLEAGSEATYADLPKYNKQIQLWPATHDMELLSEGDFCVPYLLYVPDYVDATLEASISTSKKIITKRVKLQPGRIRVAINGFSNEAAYTPRSVRVRLLAGNKVLASAQTDMTFFSQPYTKAHLLALEQELPSIKLKLEQLNARGQDISYPLVSYTVMQNFVQYAKEDVENNELKRASLSLSDMDKMKNKLKMQVSEALAGKRIFPAVPKWTGNVRPAIKSSSFLAPTTTFGKNDLETRPVFFTGYGHFSQAQADIEKYPGYGINIIQMEVGVWATLPAKGKENNAAALSTLKVLDRAQKAGVAVNLLLCPHYMPAWVYEEIKQKSPSSSSFYIQRDPLTHEVLRRHVAIMLGPIKDHPALHSICVANEPTHFWDTSELAVNDWHAWLKSHHGDITTLNSRWGTSYTSFDEVTLPYNTNKEENKEPIGRWVDCIRWNQDFLASWYQMLADAVHEIAPNMPVHMKLQTPPMLLFTDVKAGNDPYLVGCVNDINGNDSLNWYSFGGGEFATGWMTNARGEDLQRSMKDAPVFDSENHIIGDREVRYFPAEPIRADIWQEAIHGQSATTFWSWQRTFDKAHDLDFADLFMTRPACSEAVGIVNHDLNRAAKEVTALQQAPTTVAILHDTSAMIYDGLAYDDCSKRTYMALGFCGVKIGFVTERQLEAGIVPTVPVLIVPNATHISDAAFDTLQKYNGRLIMAGENLLAYNEYGKARTQRLNGETIAYNPRSTTEKDLWKLFLTKLPEWGIAPRVKLTDVKGKPVWGVESKEVQVDGKIIVNMCNYLNKPISVKLTVNGIRTSAEDLLSSQTLSSAITLQPLEIRLLKIPQ